MGESEARIYYPQIRDLVLLYTSHIMYGHRDKLEYVCDPHTPSAPSGARPNAPIQEKNTQ